MQTQIIGSSSLCVQCMRELDTAADVCPYCGGSSRMAEQPAYCLRPFSILKSKYQLGRMLGQGGFGITYIGYDLVLNIRVAIKEYFPMSYVSRDCTISNRLQWTDSLARDNLWKSGCGSFLKEARKMAKLKDIPEVVRVLDTFEENDTAYIVMDFVEGITLKQRVRQNGQLSFEKCASMLRPIMETLACIHKQGIIHRDISPDNIMLENNGHLRLLDLGAAKEITVQNHNTSQLVAKRGFSPLEQYISGSGSAGSGPWTDVYALCATMYYCVTGRTPPDALDRVGKDNLRFENTFFTEAEADLLREGMALYSQNRIQSIEELLARLDTVRIKTTAVNKANKMSGVTLVTKKWLPAVLPGFAITAVVLLMLLFLPSSKKTAPSEANIAPSNAAGITGSQEIESPALPIEHAEIIIAGRTIPVDVAELDLRESGISDISALSSLINLTTLSLRSNQVSDISSLKDLTNLTLLSLRSNQVSDINALGGLTNLSKLYLDDNQVSDISILAGLTNLTELDLSNNSIRDIHVLSGLTNLSELYLNGNQISDVSALYGLEHLTKLILNDNPVSSEQLDALRASLPDCSIIYE